MAGHFIARGAVDGVVVGADRIAANGDTANKIGTYTLSVLAKEHGLPFYVAAPLSTVDLSVQSGGDEIPIEERGEDEVTSYGGQRLAPEGREPITPLSTSHRTPTSPRSSPRLGCCASRSIGRCARPARKGAVNEAGGRNGMKGSVRPPDGGRVAPAQAPRPRATTRRRP